jgi:AcrR family transcriptional regulator
MDSPHGQDRSKRSPTSDDTRVRLLTAAAELIAEVGWGGVTTRAVATRADLPHGAVSYHFRGKQDLLTAAALHVLEHAFPISEFQALDSLSDFVGLMQPWLGEQSDEGRLITRIGIEAMLESERNPLLRERMAAMLRDFRRVLAETAAADQARGTVPAGTSPQALATLLGAIGDGLFLQARLDPDLDVAGALDALGSLLRS